MIDPQPSETVPEDREQILARLMEQILDQIQSGTEPEIERYATEHPELVDDLKQLLATAMLAEEFGSESMSGLAITNPMIRLEPSTLIGDYQILEELGRGGMGVVYKARQQKLDRIVALKMILAGASATEQDRKRFRQEAEAAARLDHPHIVPVLEVGEHRGLLYFSMKYISGETLSKRLQAGPLTQSETVRIAIEISEALAEAHYRELLHRDLKPSNILLDHVGHAFVTDFGLAKQLSTAEATLTETGAILGTPGYLSPEQASGGKLPVGKASDIFSLGSLIYTMLTGRAPFQGTTPLQTIMMVTEQEPVPPRVLNPRIDPDLQLIVMKCLQKPRELRYASMTELAQDLRAWRDHEPISARSSRFRDILNRAFRESQNAVLLENWGLLWMWHAVALLALCLITNLMQLSDWTDRTPYVLLWTVGVGIWAGIFWNLRRRSGPITFVERQIAHVWAASMAASSLLFAVEEILNLPVLTLSPILGLISGMVFVVKAGMLSGQFYLQAGALFATSMIMAWLPGTVVPRIGITLFGFVSGLSFFLPGLQYHRQRIRRRS